MPRATRALLVAPLLALAACAASSTATSVPTTTAQAHGGEAVAPQVPATAKMICSEDIKGKVQQALRLETPPATHDSWVDDVYTCRYSLPMGEMSLSDRVFPDAGAARAHLAVTRSQDGAAQSLAGLGQQAYGSSRGLAVVLKDNQILTVDTTGLPDRFGATDQRRSDLAVEVASDVLGCWTGDE
ncbi:MAG: hypothetical protein JWP40_902 [Blastococcus sp.]|jgi:hypothetical protein|nr:hypothetical protein [Blastococcus sp.]